MIHRKAKIIKVTLAKKEGKPDKIDGKYYSWIQIESSDTLGLYLHDNEEQKYFVEGQTVNFIQHEVDGRGYFKFTEEEKTQVKEREKDDGWKTAEKARAITMCAKYAVDVMISMSTEPSNFKEFFPKVYDHILNEVYKKIDEL